MSHDEWFTSILLIVARRSCRRNTVITNIELKNKTIIDLVTWLQLERDVDKINDNMEDTDWSVNHVSLTFKRNR